MPQNLCTEEVCLGRRRFIRRVVWRVNSWSESAAFRMSKPTAGDLVSWNTKASICRRMSACNTAIIEMELCTLSLDPATYVWTWYTGYEGYPVQRWNLARNSVDIAPRLLDMGLVPIIVFVYETHGDRMHMNKAKYLFHVDLLRPVYCPDGHGRISSPWISQHVYWPDA